MTSEQQQPRSVWVVFDPTDPADDWDIPFSMAGEYAEDQCHEHINEAIADGDVEGAAGWIVREYVRADEIERLERELTEAREYIDSLPGNWRTDSSLATWFPFTSEAFERTKMELVEARADNRYKSMFESAISALAAIDRELGMPEDGCNEPDATLEAIRALKRQLAERASSEPRCTCRDYPGADLFCMAHTVRSAAQPKGNLGLEAHLNAAAATGNVDHYIAVVQAEMDASDDDQPEGEG